MSEHIYMFGTLAKTEKVEFGQERCVETLQAWVSEGTMAETRERIASCAHFWSRFNHTILQCNNRQTLRRPQCGRSASDTASCKCSPAAFCPESAGPELPVFIMGASSSTIGAVQIHRMVQYLGTLLIVR